MRVILAGRGGDAGRGCLALESMASALRRGIMRLRTRYGVFALMPRCATHRCRCRCRACCWQNTRHAWAVVVVWPRRAPNASYMSCDGAFKERTRRGGRSCGSWAIGAYPFGIGLPWPSGKTLGISAACCAGMLIVGELCPYVNHRRDRSLYSGRTRPMHGLNATAIAVASGPIILAPACSAITARPSIGVERPWLLTWSRPCDMRSGRRGVVALCRGSRMLDLTPRAACVAASPEVDKSSAPHTAAVVDNSCTGGASVRNAAGGAITAWGRTFPSSNAATVAGARCAILGDTTGRCCRRESMLLLIKYAPSQLPDCIVCPCSRSRLRCHSKCCCRRSVAVAIPIAHTCINLCNRRDACRWQFRRFAGVRHGHHVGRRRCSDIRCS